MLRRLSLALRVAALGVVVASCNLTSTGPGSDGREAPDAGDRIRQLDLSPRSLRSDSSGGSSASGDAPRAFSFFGSTPDKAADADRIAAASGHGAVTTEGGVDLNFENAPIATIAKVILGDILQTGYTIDPRAQGNISLSSGRPVPKARLLFVLESALRSNNLALVRDAGGYLIAPSGEVMGSGGVDRGDQSQPGYGVSVIPLRFVSAPNVVKLLEGFSIKPGAIRSDSSGNLLVVTGSGLERRMALDTVANFDVDWMRGQSIGVYPVQNSTPEPLIAELEKILDSGEGGMGQGMVKFQAISRMNAILVVAKKPDLLRAAGTWISRLDGSQTAAVGVKVYRVRYGDAKNLSRLLNEIFLGGAGGAGLDSAASSLAPGSGASTLTPTERLTGGGQSLNPPSGAGGIGSGTGGGQGQSPFGMLRAQMTGAGAGAGAGVDPAAARGAGLPGQSGGANAANAVMQGVRITPDIVNNAVLIYANAQNYKTIERALQQLDRPQGQVAIELTIAEVTLNDNLNYGVQFFLRSSSLGLGNDRGSLFNGGAQPLKQSTPGLNFVLGSQASPSLVINALHGYTDVKVLSNPSLVVVDNQPATLQVGDQVPVATGSATVLSTSNTVVNTVDYKNTGIILRVLPRITSSGNVLLDVEQEISNVPKTDGTATLTPTISERKVKSTISVANGQTVLLAGLISDKQNKGRNGVPILDQIPILGDALSQTTKSKERTELIIFIKPQIIRDPVEASVVAEELRSKLRGSKIGSDFPPGGVVSPTPRILH